MPADVWRTRPARSISRCEAICASAGVSLMVGMKAWGRRIPCLPWLARRRRTLSAVALVVTPWRGLLSGILARSREQSGGIIKDTAPPESRELLCGAQVNSETNERISIKDRMKNGDKRIA